MKKNLLVMLSLLVFGPMALLACNLTVNATPSSVPTQTDMGLAQPLPTDSFPTMMAKLNPSQTPVVIATLTPFLPEPSGKITVQSFWDNEMGVGVTFLLESWKGTLPRVEYSVYVNGSLYETGELKQGQSSIGLEPAGIYSIEVKIGNVSVINVAAGQENQTWEQIIP